MPTGGNLTSIKVVLNSPHTGDVLAAITTGTSITKSFVNNTLTLSGTDTIANYQTVLRSVTYNNTQAGGPTVNTETINVFANDGTVIGNTAVATINMPPLVRLTIGAGTGTPNYTTNWFNSGAISLENTAQATVSNPSGLANLTSMTVTLSSPQAGDVLSVPLLPVAGLNITATGGTGGTPLTLSGSDTVLHYQQELRYISYNNTSGGPGVSSVLATVTASDGTFTSAR